MGDIDGDFRTRRAWFDGYYDKFNVGIRRAPEYGVRFTCPCCGYPTLFEWGVYEICPLCDWENDGQDDPHADEVRGGPNKDYSLTEARQNFVCYGVMYRPENDPRIGGPDSAEVRAVKQEIIHAFDAMPAADERVGSVVAGGQPESLLAGQRSGAQDCHTGTDTANTTQGRTG